MVQAQLEVKSKFHRACGKAAGGYRISLGRWRVYPQPKAAYKVSWNVPGRKMTAYGSILRLGETDFACISSILIRPSHFHKNLMLTFAMVMCFIL
jgi:hypothetical protein